MILETENQEGRLSDAGREEETETRETGHVNSSWPEWQRAFDMHDWMWG